MAEDRLTDKQIAFVNAYLGPSRFNATRAATLAGYSHPTTMGPRVKNLPAVRKLIEERLAEQAMSAGEALAILSDHALGDMGEFLQFDPRSGEPTGYDLRKLQEAGKLHLINEAVLTREGWKVKLYDAQAAATTVLRVHGMFKDKVEHSGPGGGPISFRDIVVERPPVDDDEQAGDETSSAPLED